MVCLLAYYIRKDTSDDDASGEESLRFWTSSFTSEMFMFFPLCVHQMLFTSQKGSLAICSIWAFSVFLQCESSSLLSRKAAFTSFFVLLLKEGSGRIFAILMSITLPFFSWLASTPSATSVQGSRACLGYTKNLETSHMTFGKGCLVASSWYW